MMTFLVNQVADLKDRGVEVEIFALEKDIRPSSPGRYFEYQMAGKTHYLETSESVFLRLLVAIPKIVHIFFTRPVLLFKIFNCCKYGRNALSLKLLFWVEPFLGKKFDLVHCHFGPVANKFLIIKEILGLKQPIVTTFYGYDVSRVFKQKPADYYDKLKKESSLFLVMSNNMKERVVARGFPAERVRVLPVSIDVESYPFSERTLKPGQTINIISVGNFVEKKGFDDLLRALAIVREKTKKPFKCTIVGDGPLREKIYGLTEKLKLKNLVEFKGYMKIENIIEFFKKMHLFVQPSKTASDGDME